MALTEQDRINAKIAGRLRALTDAAKLALDGDTRATMRTFKPITSDFSTTGLDTEEERSLYGHVPSSGVRVRHPVDVV